MTTDTILAAAQYGYAVDDATGAVLIPLGGKKLPGLNALVDSSDVGIVAPYFWHPTITNPRNQSQMIYAQGRVGEAVLYLHRVIMNATDPRVKVDHINRNGLDNRRCNLRFATNQQNGQNRIGNVSSTSRFKGVSWVASKRRWDARIHHSGRVILLGRFKDEEAAARAYDSVARELFGEFALFNFPEELERSA